MMDALTHETGVIGSILFDSRCMPDVTGLVSADDFTADSYREIYETATNMYAAGETVDPVTIAGEMRRAGLMTPEIERLMIDLLQMTATASNASLYAKGLRDEANMRRICKLLNGAMMEYGDPDELTDAVMEGLYGIERGGRRGGSITLKEAIAKFTAWASKDADEACIDLGYPRLDKMLRGMSPGNLVLLAARPGVGKSAFAADLALRTAECGTGTAIFSCEMSILEIVQRYVANRAGIDLDDVLDRKFKHGEAAKRTAGALSEMGEFPLRLYDEPGITVADIRRELQTKKGIGFVVVDYIQLMQSVGKSENRNLEVAKISGDLKKLAREFSIPIMALSQLNRGKDEIDEPSLNDFRDSGALEQDADIAIFVWKLGQPKPGELAKIGVKIAKNRMGQTGVVVMYFDGAHMSYKETAEEYTPKKQGRGRQFQAANSYDPDFPTGW